MMQIEKEQLLKEITDLSHEFGTEEYVCGGGGNTSVKNRTMLWVKPSGTTLAGLRPQSFVALDRRELSRLYLIQPPQGASEREALVKETMAAAMLAGQNSRPSVEAALHDSLSARFVVHTHPAAVNGMTCAKDGKTACGRLFPEALWLDYCDPGYTLCLAVRRRIEEFRRDRSREPSVIFLKNHGVFVAGEYPQEIRDTYAEIFDRLSAEYKKAGISTQLQVPSLPKGFDPEAQSKKIREGFGEDKLYVAACGAFEVAKGPLSPDHIVYARSYPLIGEPTPEVVSHYRGRCGYPPQIVVWDRAVYGTGSSEKKAALALELARNGALVVQLAGAFGGVEYMTEAARRFIEGWEVESYRSSQIQ